MFSAMFLVAVVIVILFGFVILFGAPYLPTLSPQISETFKLLGLKKGDTLLELGSGDGRVLLAAARRGIYAIGYEINPILYFWSLLLTIKYRKYVTVHFKSYWSTDLPKTDGIYVFLLQKYMKRLDKKIIQNYSGQRVKLVSLAFTIPDRKPIGKSKGLYLYDY